MTTSEYINAKCPRCHTTGAILYSDKTDPIHNTYCVACADTKLNNCAFRTEWRKTTKDQAIEQFETSFVETTTPCLHGKVGVEEVSDCPECGGDNIWYIRDTTNSKYTFYGIRCFTCKHSIPTDWKQKGAAVIAWNKAATPEVLGEPETGEVDIREAYRKHVFGPDMVNSPPHYQRIGIPDCIEVIEALALPYHLGNVMKYIWRWDTKGEPLENLRKAKWYLDRYIEGIE